VPPVGGRRFRGDEIEARHREGQLAIVARLLMELAEAFALRLNRKARHGPGNHAQVPREGTDVTKRDRLAAGRRLGDVKAGLFKLRDGQGQRPRPRGTDRCVEERTEVTEEPVSELLSDETTTARQDACHLPRHERFMAVHDEMKRRVSERQTRFVSCDVLEDVVRHGFHAYDLDTERLQTLGGNREVRHPGFCRDRLGGSVRERSKPLATASSHIEHIRRAPHVVDDDGGVVPR